MSLSGPFLFDPRAFWGDENVRKMTGEQVAAYLRLLSLQWEEGSIPADADTLAMLLTDGARRYTTAEFEADIWPAVAPCFQVLNRRSTGRLINPRLRDERVHWVSVKCKKSAAGVASGKARRAASSVKSETKPANTRSTPVQTKQEQNANLSSSSSCSSSLLGDHPTEIQSKTPKTQDEGFEQFWAAWPRKVAKADARKAWKQTRKDHPPVDDLVAAVSAQSAAADWPHNLSFCPYPATWLRACRWEDDAAGLKRDNGRPSRHPSRFGPRLQTSDDESDLDARVHDYR